MPETRSWELPIEDWKELRSLLDKGGDALRQYGQNELAGKAEAWLERIETSDLLD